MGEFYDVIIPISREILLEQSEDAQVQGGCCRIMTFTIKGKDGKESASLCNFLYTLAYMP